MPPPLAKINHFLQVNSSRLQVSYSKLQVAVRFHAVWKPVASHSVRSTCLSRGQGLGSKMIPSCARWPVPPWTTLWPVDGGHSLRLHPGRPPPINGLTTAPLTRGARPPEPPAALRTAHVFINFRTARNSPPACALRLPFPLVTLREGCRRWPSRPWRGGLALPGVWGCNPLPWSRLRRRAGRRGESEPRSGYALCSAPQRGAFYWVSCAKRRTYIACNV